MAQTQILMEQKLSKQALIDRELDGEEYVEAPEKKRRSSGPHQAQHHKKVGTSEVQYRKASKKRWGDPLDRAYVTESSEADFLLEAMPSIVSEYGSAFAREAVRASDSFAWIRDFDSRYFSDPLAERTPNLAGLDLLGPGSYEDEDGLIDLLPELMQLRGQRAEVMKAGMDVIAGSPEDTTEAISKEYENFMGSHKAYSLIKKGRASGKAGMAALQNVVLNEARREQLQPLIDMLGQPEVGAAVRAETFSRMALYISSGWAEHDLNDGNHSAGAVKVRDLIERIRKGESVSVGDVQRVMSERLTAPEIFVQGVVETRGGKYKIKALSSKQLTGIRKDMFDGTQTQGSGMVDAIVRDARNPSLITVAVVTADKDFVKARDQLARHTLAIQNSIKEGHPPFSKGDQLASIQMHSLAMVPEGGRSQLRDDLQAAYVAGGVAWDNRNDTNFFNLQVLFSLLGASSSRGLDANTVLQTRHRRYGAGNTPFEQRDELEQAKEVAKYLAENIHRLGAAAPYLRLVNPSNPKPNAAILQPLSMLMESIDGLQQRYGSIRPDDPRAGKEEKIAAAFIRETIQGVLPQIKAIAEMGAAQDNQLDFVNTACRVIGRYDPSWITEYHAHVVDEDNEGRPVTVHAVSRARAEEIWARESSIRRRQDLILHHLQESIDKRDLSVTTRASLAGVRKALAFAAVKFDDEMIDHLVKSGVGKRISQTHKEVVIPSTGKVIPLLFVNESQMKEVARQICTAPDQENRYARMLSTSREKKKEKRQSKVNKKIKLGR